MEEIGFLPRGEEIPIYSRMFSLQNLDGNAPGCKNALLCLGGGILLADGRRRRSCTFLIWRRLGASGVRVPPILKFKEHYSHFMVKFITALFYLYHY